MANLITEPCHFNQPMTRQFFARCKIHLIWGSENGAYLGGKVVRVGTRSQMECLTSMAFYRESEGPNITECRERTTWPTMNHNCFKTNSNQLEFKTAKGEKTNTAAERTLEPYCG